MKRFLILLTTIFLIISSAPLQGVQASRRMTIESNSGMTAFIPNEMEKGKFKMTFKVKVPEYIDHNGKVRYIDDYRSVKWDIKGCGIDTVLYLNREDNYSQLVGVNPKITVSGVMPEDRECKIVTNSSFAMPCEPDTSGNCRNNDMLIPLPLTINITFRPRVIKIVGPRRVISGSQVEYASTFSPLDEKDLLFAEWSWRAKGCSKATYHKNLSPTYLATIKDGVQGFCKIEAEGMYVTQTEGMYNGVEFGLHYIGGVKNVRVLRAE